MSLPQERMTEQRRRLHDDIYGLDQEALGGSGPSVVTVSSLLASLAATEVMWPAHRSCDRRRRNLRTAAASEPWDDHAMEDATAARSASAGAPLSRHVAAG